MQATIQHSAQILDRRIDSGSVSFAPSIAAWFRLAAIYLLVSVGLGVAMGASGDFTLRSVHSHISLLGWTTLALAGLIYQAFPEAGTSRLARIHFWLYNVALPPMMGSLAALLLGHPGAVPILVGSQFVVAAGLLAFVINVFLRVKQPPTKQSPGVDNGSQRIPQRADDAPIGQQRSPHFHRPQQKERPAHR